jgi:methylthioribulose-1-phosphate dehydratase
MDARGWVPATAGNLSVRAGAGRIAITASGTHKGRLGGDDVIAVDLEGRPEDPARPPSAETLLHCQLYRLDPAIGAVLHGHSVAATVLTLAAGETIRLAGYEVLKALGASTHDTARSLPVIDNDQDIPRLAGQVAARLDPALPAYALRGHGVYAWGATIDQALARLEAVEFLLACELERRRMR